MNHTHSWVWIKLAATLSARVAGTTHLDVSWEGEVLPEGVTFKAVVCQNTPQVWVVGKEHTIHVPHLQKHTQTLSFVCITVKKAGTKWTQWWILQAGRAGCDSPPSRTSWQPCAPWRPSPQVSTHLCTSWCGSECCSVATADCTRSVNQHTHIVTINTSRQAHLDDIHEVSVCVGLSHLCECWTHNQQDKGRK